MYVKKKRIRDIKNSYDTADFRWERREGYLKLIHVPSLPFDGLRYLRMKSSDFLQASYALEYRFKGLLFVSSLILIFSQIFVNLPDGIILLAFTGFIASIIMKGRLKGRSNKIIEEMDEERLSYSIESK